MPTSAELVVGAELADLKEVAAVAGWIVGVLNTLEFVVGLKAADDSPFWVVCHADDYKATPPAWHWCDAHGSERDKLHLAPRAGSSAFFHDNGVICAPGIASPTRPWTLGGRTAIGRSGTGRTTATRVPARR